MYARVHTHKWKSEASELFSAFAERLKQDDLYVSVNLFNVFYGMMQKSFLNFVVY